MALLPVTLRRSLRRSGFTEEQTEALDEASEATAEAAREGLARQEDVNSQSHEVTREIGLLRAELRSEIAALRSEVRMLRGEMRVIQWRTVGMLSTVILAATAAIIAAVAVWG